MVLRRTGVRKEQAQEQEQEKHGQQEVSERRYYQQEQHDDNNDRQRMITMGIIPYVAKAGSQVVRDHIGQCFVNIRLSFRGCVMNYPIRVE
jgi:hypothetical protein